MRMSIDDTKPKSNLSSTPNAIHRKCNTCENEEEDEAAEKPVMRKKTFASAASPPLADTPPSIKNVINSGGQPLDLKTRNFFEPRFGTDLSHIRVYTDAAAGQSARAIDSKAYTLRNDIIFGEGEYQPDSQSGKSLLAHELAHVTQQSRGTINSSEPAIRRKKCGHDGQPTGCGANLGVLKFPDDDYKIDKRIVDKTMSDNFGGKWLTQVQTPPNTVKSGKDKGFVDGLKISFDGALEIEIIEVKPRAIGDPSLPTGGCEKATGEAKGYVSALQTIASKVQSISEKIIERFPNHGFRLDGHHVPKGKVETEIFSSMGIDITDQEWLQAWTFYNSLQQKIPKVFKRAFTAVNIKVNADGKTDESYDALSYQVDCKLKNPKKPVGVGKLSYMVNQEGGVSYGCKEICGEKEEEKKREEKKQVTEVPVAPQTRRPRVQAIHPIFEMLYRDAEKRPVPGNLPEVLPNQYFTISVSEDLYNGVIGALILRNYLIQTQIRVPDWLHFLNAFAISMIIAQVTCFAVAGGVALAPLVAPAAAVPAAAAPPVAAAGAGTGGGVVILLLRTAAANDNAIAIVQAAAAFILAINSASGNESAGESAVESALKNKSALAVQDVTSDQTLANPGSETSFGGNKYRTIVVFGTEV